MMKYGISTGFGDDVVGTKQMRGEIVRPGFKYFPPVSESSEMYGNFEDTRYSRAVNYAVKEKDVKYEDPNKNVMQFGDLPKLQSSCCGSFDSFMAQAA